MFPKSSYKQIVLLKRPRPKQRSNRSLRVITYPSSTVTQKIQTLVRSDLTLFFPPTTITARITNTHTSKINRQTQSRPVNFPANKQHKPPDLQPRKIIVNKTKLNSYTVDTFTLFSLKPSSTTCMK